MGPRCAQHRPHAPNLAQPRAPESFTLLNISPTKANRGVTDAPQIPQSARWLASFRLHRLSRLSASAQRSQGSQPPPGWRMLLGCPMSQPPRKPLFWHALFVISICLCVVHCVLVRTVSHIEVTDVLNLIRQRREQTPSRASKQAVFSFLRGKTRCLFGWRAPHRYPCCQGTLGWTHPHCSLHVCAPWPERRSRPSDGRCRGAPNPGPVFSIDECRACSLSHVRRRPAVRRKPLNWMVGTNHGEG